MIALSLTILLQIGSYAQISFETFYNLNTIIMAGASYRDHKAGLFYQTATSNDGLWYNRYGLYTDFVIGNADDILILYAGFRLAQSNDNFFGFTPHGTMAWRVSKYAEIPITFSLYAQRLVGSIGVRGMLPGRTKNCKIYYPPRRALQPTSLEPSPRQ